MKLHEVPRKRWVKITGVEGFDGIIFFDHIDGMYSLCTTVQDVVTHIGASTEVSVLSKSDAALMDAMGRPEFRAIFDDASVMDAMGRPEFRAIFADAALMEAMGRPEVKAAVMAADTN